MIALDINVVVRFLVEDDPDQAALAGEVISGLAVDTPGFISREVMVERVRLLERAYHTPRGAVADALEGLLAASEIEIEAADDVGLALFRYRDNGFGCADLMIAAASRRVSASELVPFDGKAARIDGVRLLA